MIALDTNVVLRYALKDDPEQTRLATDFLRSNPCVLLPTVVLEAAWVMGSKRGYALDRTTVAERLRHVGGLPNVHVAQAKQIAAALRWYEAGMDIADAMHLALAGSEQGLVTLDKAISRLAERLQLNHPVVLLGPEP